MKAIKYISLLLATLLMTGNLNAQKIERVEPLCWWTDMKLPLRLMFYGQDLQNAEISVKEPGITVTGTHNADSKNYLFADIAIEKAGTYTFTLKKGRKKATYKYTIHQRDPQSATRNSFTSADVIYLIMSDRFANGDPSNDSRPETAEKANRTSWQGRHGGDIQGVINHLDYIKELGATTIWCTPMLLDNEPVYSYHGYACADYYHIDPRFGSNELYKQMVDESHKLGLKVIMDIVTNHCGLAHWWMKDLPYEDWIHQFPELTRTNNVFSANIDPNASKYDLNIHESGWFDTAMPDMNLDNPDMLHYFKQWAIWWIEYAGLDGLRVDTYPYNEKEPIAEWTKAVRTEYPNINIVGECWTSPASQVAYWQSGVNNRDGYDSQLPSVMDFPLQQTICEALNEDGTGWNQGTVRIYSTLASDYLYADVNNLLVFSGNHDTERIGDILGENKDKAKLAATIVATMRGIPQLFYGEEQLLLSQDRTQGHGGLRAEFPGGWPNDTTNLFKATGRNALQTEMFDYYKQLFNWRKNEPVIHTGKTMHFLSRDNSYAYFRYNDQEAVLIYINASNENREIPWHTYNELLHKYHTIGTAVLSGKQIDNQQPYTVAPMSSLIVKFVTPK